MQLRILAITDSYPPYHAGGYELRCRDVLRSLMEKGHCIEIITTLPPSNSLNVAHDAANISRVLHKKSGLPSTYSRVIHDYIDIWHIDQKVKKFQPDLIYLWHIGDLSGAILPFFSNKLIPIVLDDGGAGSVFAAKLLGKGLYFYNNKNDPVLKSRAKKLLNRMISTLSFKLIKPNWSWPNNMSLFFNSKASLVYAQSNGVPIKGSKVIYSGIDISNFSYKPRSRINRPLRIITPGRISPEKGTKDALLLLSELKKRHISSTLILVGKVYSAPYYEEVIRQINDLGLDEDITILPMVEHKKMSTLYQEADICFFPSFQRFGLSRVPLEAMACGCLVITYGNEGSSEILVSGESGYTIQEKDILAASNFIQALMENDEKYRMLVQNARAYIEEKHSMEVYVNKVETALISLAGKG